MRCSVHLSTIAVVVSVAVLGAGMPVEGSAIYLNIPSITGEDPTPGYPGAIAVNSLNVSPDNFSIQKMIDSATPKIQLAVIGGTPLHTVSALFYNAAPSGPPDAILPFNSVFASSQSLGILTETDAFVGTTPDSMYLAVSGITGESSTPGYSGLMQIDSLAISGNTFTVDRLTDSATPQLTTALLLGTHHTASLLFYNSAPSGPPDAELDFQDVLVSSLTHVSGGDRPHELDGFNFISISQPTPEPSTLALLVIGMTFFGIKRFRRTLTPAAAQ
jgi:type VI protein secretion system component Hcp